MKKFKIHIADSIEWTSCISTEKAKTITLKILGTHKPSASKSIGCSIAQLGFFLICFIVLPVYIVFIFYYVAHKH